MIAVKTVKDMPNGIALMGYTGFLSVDAFVAQLEKQGYNGPIYVNNKQTTIYMERVSWTHATNVCEKSKMKNSARLNTFRGSIAPNVLRK